jgi:hypothetical protein
VEPDSGATSAREIKPINASSKPQGTSPPEVSSVPIFSTQATSESQPTTPPTVESQPKSAEPATFPPAVTESQSATPQISEQPPTQETKSHSVEAPSTLEPIPPSTVVVLPAKPRKPFTSLSLVVLLIVAAAVLAWFYNPSPTSHSPVGGDVLSASTTTTSIPIVTSTADVPSTVLPNVDINNITDPVECAALDFNLRDQCYMRTVLLNGSQEVKMACKLIKADYLRDDCLSLGLRGEDVRHELMIASSAIQNLSQAKCWEISLPQYKQECLDVVSVISKASETRNLSICIVDGNISMKSRIDCLNRISGVGGML